MFHSLADKESLIDATLKWKDFHIAWIKKRDRNIMLASVATGNGNYSIQLQNYKIACVVYYCRVM